jgi:hypothetical protein
VQNQKPTLEIHIPISPTAHFFNMVHYLLHTLRRNGGGYSDAKVVLTIGAEEHVPDLHQRLPWLKKHGVEIRWVSDETFAQHSWWGTVLERFRHEFTSDVVLMLDADVLISRPLGMLVREIHQMQVLAGVTACLPPVDSMDIWQNYYNACGLGPVKPIHALTGMGTMFNDEALRYTPPYFNFGVVCAPAAIMNRIGEELFPILESINGVKETYFRTQVALSITITKLSIPYQCLPVRYNTPNRMDLRKTYPKEFENTHIIHLVAKQNLDKAAVFKHPDGVAEYLALQDLKGINRQVQVLLNTVQNDVVGEFVSFE